MPEAKDKGPQEFDEEKDPVLVEFPVDSLRMPEPLLPRPIGRISQGHPLIRPLITILMVFVLAVVVFFIVGYFKMSNTPADRLNPQSIGAEYREEGKITWQDTRLDGWFLDSAHEHFMSTDGRRFTYVSSHQREGSPVSGYWRLVE
jgi:hypothetical protein